MRTETITRDLYQIHELDEQAQSRALDAMREADWSGDLVREDVPETILWSLAATLSPGTDCAEPKGIDLLGWDLDRGQSLTLKGTLDPDNAPGLPWTEGILAVDLYPYGYGTSVEVCYERGSEAAAQAMREAINDALHEALKAGTRQMGWLYGDEYLMESATINEVEFLVDGTLA